MIFWDMYDNIKGKWKERFLAFPRFIQIIINQRHQKLILIVGTLPLKWMNPNIFSYMVMNKKGKNIFTRIRSLEKFERLFVGLEEEIDDQGTPIAFVVEEHDQDTATTSAQEAKTDKVTSSESSDGETELVKE
ncbi:hypothetical protein R6Q57_014656 [Mikania cordata]